MSDTLPDQHNGPPWDDAIASAIIGKTVLIGLTEEDHAGQVKARHQMYGVVISASRQRGIEIALAGTRQGETYRLPPTTSAFTPAEPGEYRLRGSGDVVEDPDYTSVWTITSPPPA